MVIVQSTGRLGATVQCEKCRAGELFSFDWGYAKGRHDAEHSALVEALHFQERLRRGQFYRCSACGAYWYLDPRQKVMTIVPAERMGLLREWNRRPIRLSLRILAKLRSIGSSPPYYGIGTEYRETPCTAITTSGDRIELAVFSPQSGAPVEDWRNYRLGSEIADVEESPCALPLKVRIAAAKAQEVAMGFAPTVIEMPNGEAFTLNGSANFLVVPGQDARTAKLSRRPFETGNHPPIVSQPENIVYFVVDAPGSIWSALLGRS